MNRLSKIAERAKSEPREIRRLGSAYASRVAHINAMRDDLQEAANGFARGEGNWA